MSKTKTFEFDTSKKGLINTNRKKLGRPKLSDSEKRTESLRISCKKDDYNSLFNDWQKVKRYYPTLSGYLLFRLFNSGD